MSDAYRAVIADLTTKRDSIDAAIKGLQGLIVETSAPAPERRKRKERRTWPKAPVRKAGRRTADVAAPDAGVSAAVGARDTAILTQLRKGMARREDLKKAMPKEADLTPDQLEAAFRNTLTRLKSKGVIDRTGDTWSLVDAGSDRG